MPKLFSRRKKNKSSASTDDDDDEILDLEEELKKAEVSSVLKAIQEEDGTEVVYFHSPKRKGRKMDLKLLDNHRVSLSEAIIHARGPIQQSIRRTLHIGVREIIIFLVDIREIHTPSSIIEKREMSRASLSMAITFDDLLEGERTVDLQFDDEKTFRNWYRGLKHLRSEALPKYQINPSEVLHEKAWLKADKNRDGTVKRDELSKTLKTNANIKIDDHALDTRLSACDRNKDKQLTQVEFKALLTDLEMRPIDTSKTTFQEVLWDRYAGKRRMKADQFLNFLRTEQKQITTLNEAQRLLKELHGASSGLDVILWSIYLTQSSLNTAWDPLTEHVYQEMDRPFTEYYISMAYHANTPLPVKGIKSLKVSISNALRNGIRCFHLPITRGKLNEPLVGDQNDYVGNGELGDVLATFKKEAFKGNNSKYPVILYLEVFLSDKVQEKMVKILKDSLGFALSTDKSKKSPAQNKEKFLLLMKRSVNKDKEGAKPELIDDLKALCYFDLIMFDTSISETAKHAGKRQDGFRKVVLMNEVQLENALDRSDSSFVDMNDDFLSMAVPKNEKANKFSTQAWSGGVHLVAINYHHIWDGKEIDVHRAGHMAKFKNNGNCGYVLKSRMERKQASKAYREADAKAVAKAEANKGNPAAEDDEPYKPIGTLHDPLDPSPLIKANLHVKVICARHLPNPTDESGDSDIVDPYVLLKLTGAKEDVTERRTKTIQDNGFNPVWDQQFEFPITQIQHAILHLIVKDKDIMGDDFLCQTSIPVTCLRQGFRTIFLTDETGEVMAESPTLTCYFNITKSGNVQELWEEIERLELDKRALEHEHSAYKNSLEQVQKDTKELRKNEKKLERKNKVLKEELRERKDQPVWINSNKWIRHMPENLQDALQLEPDDEEDDGDSSDEEVAQEGQPRKNPFAGLSTDELAESKECNCTIM